MKYYSKQREEILETVKHNHNHPTAEEIYYQVKKIDNKISKSTVYRNLSLLVEEERLLKITTYQGADCYDYLEKEHCHAVCKICGKVFDFKYHKVMKDVVEELKKQTGLQAEEEGVVIRGVCHECQLKK